MKVLIAEDDAVCQKVLIKFLADLGQVDVAADGAEAWEKYQIAIESGSPYELICLDIMMPHFNGKEVLAKVRSFELEQGLPTNAKILMTTALSDTETIVASFQTGCEAYITKPIERNQLHEELARLGIHYPVKH